MKKVLLISENQIKQSSIIELNADSKVLSKVILDVQKLVLRPVLGDQLYNQVVDEVCTTKTEIGHEMNATIKVLMDEYIKDFLVATVLQDWIVTNNYKMTNKGMVKLTDSNATTLSDAELEHAKNYYDQKVSGYKLNLISYLKSQKLIDGGTDQNVSSESIGWFMDSDAPYPTSSFVPTIPNGGSSGPVAWDDVTNKPTTFTPSAHTHTYDSITEKPSVFAPAPHAHNYDSITDKPTEFNPSAHTHSYDSITGKPTEFNPSAHNQAWSTITDKPSTYAPSPHNHSINEVTNLQTTLDAKADLVGGLIPSSQLPSYVDDVIEVNTFFNLPAIGESGKMYVTLSDNKVYRWSGTVYTQIVASPGSTDEVPEGTVNKYFTDSRAIAALSTSLAGKSNTGHTHSVGDITDLSTYTGFDSRYFTEAEVSTLIGTKADSTHTHSASDITSGILSTARLGSGTADSTTYLRGDGAWAPVASGSSLSGLTYGYLTKATSASTIGNSSIYESSSNVYIGTTTPFGFGAAKFTVNGNFTIADTSNSNALIMGYYAGTDVMTMQSYGSKLVLNPDGNNVGVNTYNPQATLDVLGTFQTSGVNTLSNLAGSPTYGSHRLTYTTSAGVLSNSSGLGYTPGGYLYSDGLYAYGASGLGVGYTATFERNVIMNNTAGTTKIKGKTWIGNISAELGSNVLMVRGGSAAFVGGTIYDNPGTGSEGGFIIGSTSTYSFLQAYNSSPIVINALGNSVLIGTTTSDGVNILQVEGSVKITGNLNNSSYAVHPDNAAAIAAGLPVGRHYRTPAGQVMVRF